MTDVYSLPGISGPLFDSPFLSLVLFFVLERKYVPHAVFKNNDRHLCSLKNEFEHMMFAWLAKWVELSDTQPVEIMI